MCYLDGVQSPTTVWSAFVERAESQRPLFVAPGRVRAWPDVISWAESRRLVAEVAADLELAPGERLALAPTPRSATMIQALAAWSRGALVAFDDHEGAASVCALQPQSGPVREHRALASGDVSPADLALPGVTHGALAAAATDVVNALGLARGELVAVVGALAASSAPLLMAPIVAGGALWLEARNEGAVGDIAALRPAVIAGSPEALAFLADELELRATSRGPIRAALARGAFDLGQRRRAARTVFGKKLRCVVGADDDTARRLARWGIDTYDAALRRTGRAGGSAAL